MNEIELTFPELQIKAVEVLFRELGPKNAIRFLGLNPNGKGNYTEERRKIYDHMTMEEILEGIRKMEREKAEEQNPST